MLQLQQASNIHDDEEKKDEEEEENEDNEENDEELQQLQEHTNENETTWQYKHCRWLACAVNFGPSNLRKIRLTGIHILSQPLIRVLSCLSFIVHLELAHFHAFKLTTMDLQGLE